MRARARTHVGGLLYRRGGEPSADRRDTVSREGGAAARYELYELNNPYGQVPHIRLLASSGRHSIPLCQKIDTRSRSPASVSSRNGGQGSASWVIRRVAEYLGAGALPRDPHPYPSPQACTRARASAARVGEGKTYPSSIIASPPGGRIPTPWRRAAAPARPWPRRTRWWRCRRARGRRCPA